MVQKKIFSAVLAFIVLASSFGGFGVQPLVMQAKSFMNDDWTYKPGVYEQLEKIKRDAIGSQEEWIKSGNYYYEFIDKGNSYITIRKIEQEAVQSGKLTIPEKIDGYPVLGIGLLNFDFQSVSMEWSDICVMDKVQAIEELVLPEGLEVLGTCSFYGCDGLKKILLPESLVMIEYGSLYGCAKLKEIEFPQGVYVSSGAFGSREGAMPLCYCNPRKVILYSDSLISFDVYSMLLFPYGKQTVLYIRHHEKDSYNLKFIPGYIKKVYVDKKLSEFCLRASRGEDDTLLDYRITRLIMNGKNTKLILSEGINEVLPVGSLQELYTVKGAKSIKEAKKYRIPVYWKTSGKAKEVKAKKKSGRYQASWKEIKTKVHKNYFDMATEKWITKKTPAKTVYKVYGKKKKSGSYMFLKTTKKRSIKSKYKYIKAVPVKEWE